jgi:hypothetical protein
MSTTYLGRYFSCGWMADPLAGRVLARDVLSRKIQFEIEWTTFAGSRALRMNLDRHV